MKIHEVGVEMGLLSRNESYLCFTSATGYNLQQVSHLSSSSSRLEFDSHNMHPFTSRLGYSHTDLRLFANCSKFDLANTRSPQ